MILGRAWSASQNNILSMITVVIGVKSNEMARILEKQDKRIKLLEAKLDSYSDLLSTIAQMSERLESAETQLSEITATQK